MVRSSSFFSYHPGAKTGRAARATRGVADFLRSNDRLSALLPIATRLAGLQQDCLTILPNAFEACYVLHFENGQLVLAAPNSAFAAKLKQQLPKLQEALSKRGWQVNAIRIKLQAGKIVERTPSTKQLSLPPSALAAMASLKDTLEDSPRNQALKAALETMVKRHRRDR